MFDKTIATMNRRTILKTTGTIVLAGFATSGHTIAQTDLPVEISQNAEEEYITITNTGDEEVDLTGYQINFEAGEDSNVNQIRELSGEVLIPAGEDILVPTGSNEISGDNIGELVDPYQTEVLNNENPDVVALLDPDGNVVASTGETGSSDPGTGSGGDDNASDGGESGDENESDLGDTGDEKETDGSGASDDGSEMNEIEMKTAMEADEPDKDGDGVAASEDDDDCVKIQ